MGFTAQRRRREAKAVLRAQQAQAPTVPELTVEGLRQQLRAANARIRELEDRLATKATKAPPEPEPEAPRPQGHAPKPKPGKRAKR
jgi:hypothetical protein